MIEFRNVGKSYNDQTVLKSINMTIKEGEFFVLVGPSGSGKTTTLKMLNRLIEPTQGDIYLRQQRLIDYHLRTLRLSIGYVLQQIALFPNLTVSENIELILEMKHWDKKARNARVRELLTKVHLAPDSYMHRKPAELSGGEQQRIGILRAIAAKPQVILMDEPFSALDPISRKQLQQLIKELHQELSCTIVFVTHDMNEALLLGDRIAVMREGMIEQLDTPKNIQQQPTNEFVAQFFANEQSVLETSQVYQLMDQRCFEPIFTESGVAVSTQTSIATVIALLSEDKQVMVKEHNQVIGHISEMNILCFLNRKLTKGDHADVQVN